MDISKTHTTNASLKWFVLTIAIISIALLSYPAKAESGSITVSNETNANWSTNDMGVFTNEVIRQNDNFTQFAFDTGNFTSVVNYTVWDFTGELTYAFPNEVTSFTITANGTGSGTASYSRFLRRMQWVFSGNTVITGSPFNVTYSQNIFNNVSSTGGGNGWDFVAASSINPPQWNHTSTAMPMYVFNGSMQGANFAGRALLGYTKAPNTRRLILSGIFSSGTVTNFYEITYPNEGYYLATITKTGQTVSTKDILHTETNNSYGYYTEENFNTNDFQVLMPQLDGIYLNVTMATGDFNNVLINASGTSISPVVSPNASDPNNPNCPVNCIETSKPTYNNTESVNIFGSFYPATTTVTECLFFGFICEDTVISKESTTGYVFISTQGSTSPVKFLSFTPDMNDNYNLFTGLNIGTYQAQLIGFAGPGTTCQGGIVYDFPFIPLGCYYPHNITSFSVVNASGNLSIVWQTKISNSTAIYGDTVTVAWSNVTANDTVIIYDQTNAIQQRYNTNQSTIKQIPVFIPLFNIGQWRATIFNASNSNHNVSAYLNVVPPGSVDVNNSFGITMYWSKASDVINNPTFLNWNTGTYTGRYNISILQNGNEIRRNAYYGVPGQTQEASYTFGEQGAYIAQFLDYPNETVQAQADIFISATTSTGGGTGGVGTANESGNNLVGSSNLILNIPWIGLMVLIIVIFGLVKNDVPTGFSIFTVAITISISAVIGLWEEWGIYITVLSWLLVAVFFRLNKTVEV